MCLKFLGTITYALDQTSLGGTEYFAVQANGDFYVKNGIEVQILVQSKIEKVTFSHYLRQLTEQKKASNVS